MEAEELLPNGILSRASLSYKEYAWHPSDIPDVIEAARDANLVSLGGQLQFRLPAATCECYWVNVDTSGDIGSDISWKEHVNRSAAAALAAFQSIVSTTNFVAEGREAFGKHFDDFEAGGGDLGDAMYFVWYVETEEGLARLAKEFGPRNTSILSRIRRIFRIEPMRD